MTDDQPARAEPGLTDEELSALLDRPFTELTVDELMAIKAAFEVRGSLVYNHYFAFEALTALSVAGVAYFKAYLETLAQHHAEATINAVRRRFRHGDKAELLLGPRDGSAAWIVVTPETPDEARLALLDLDVTAQDFRGKELRWDAEAMAWRPEKPEE